MILKSKKFSIMKLFSRKKNKSVAKDGERSLPRPYNAIETVPVSHIPSLPGPILERIFSFVCPHTQDNTYDTCEDSAIEDTCMLCDLRDLSHCAQVSQKWRAEAIKVL